MKHLIVGLLLATVPVAGQTPDTPPANTIRLEPGAPRPPARIDDVAWLAGAWEGEGLGGTLDEVWSPPKAGAMVGYFRLVKDGKPVFYEILTLLEAEGSLELRLKHVNPDTFRFVKQDATGVWFEGLTFRRLGEDRLEAFLALRNRTDGTVREEKLVYRRVR